MKSLSGSMTATVRRFSIAGAIVLLAADASYAAFTPLPPGTPEIPGAGAPLTGTSGLTGTIIAYNDSPFIESPGIPTPAFQGILRSMVVERSPGLLDFYYQLVNTSDLLDDDIPEDDLFRVKTIGGLDPALTASATFRPDGIAGLLVDSGVVIPGGVGSLPVGTKPIYSVDRDVATAGSLGFDMGPLRFLGDPANVLAGEASNFLVIRTDGNSYQLVDANISGFGTGTGQAFVPAAIPEAGTSVAGLIIMVTICVQACRRRARPSRGVRI